MVFDVNDSTFFFYLFKCTFTKELNLTNPIGHFADIPET